MLLRTGSGRQCGSNLSYPASGSDARQFSAEPPETDMRVHLRLLDQHAHAASSGVCANWLGTPVWRQPWPLTTMLWNPIPANPVRAGHEGAE